MITLEEEDANKITHMELVKHEDFAYNEKKLHRTIANALKTHMGGEQFALYKALHQKDP